MATKARAGARAKAKPLAKERLLAKARPRAKAAQENSESAVLEANPACMDAQLCVSNLGTQAILQNLK